MKILVACEESQRVTNEFRKLGHKAYSCDVAPCSGEHKEWHIQQDVIPLLNGNCEFKTCDGVIHKIIGEWDMILAFPPCTHLAVSGARHFETKRKDGRQEEALNFFCEFLNCKCSKVVIENPVGIISGEYVKQHFPLIATKYNLPIKPTQIIQPWQFGDNYKKTTCLWIKGLPPLLPQVTKEPELEYIEFISKDGKKKRQPLWYYNALRLPARERACVRSKTFQGVARAMAEQWG